MSLYYTLTLPEIDFVKYYTGKFDNAILLGRSSCQVQVGFVLQIGLTLFLNCIADVRSLYMYWRKDACQKLTENAGLHALHAHLLSVTSDRGRFVKGKASKEKMLKDTYFLG